MHASGPPLKWLDELEGVQQLQESSSISWFATKSLPPYEPHFLHLSKVNQMIPRLLPVLTFCALLQKAYFRAKQEKQTELICVQKQELFIHVSLDRGKKFVMVFKWPEK